MCNGCKMAAVLSTVVLLAGPVLAQRQGGGRGNLAALLSNPSVQKELKLSDEQIDKAKKVAQDLREKYKEDFAKIRDAKPEERAQKFQELSGKISAEARKAVAGILKPEQAKRLRQIELQQAGLNDVEAQKALKVSDEQKKKLQGISEDANKERREIVKSANGNFQEAVEKMAKLRKETREKQEKVLTEEQKKEWKAMQGEPFEVKFERRKKD
jgi:hypothetical protein